MSTHVFRVAGLAAVLYATRRYYRNWGTTKEECAMSLPGDELIRRPAVQSTEGIWIDAPPAAIWPWIAQIGQDRAGLYGSGSVEKLIGLGVGSDGDSPADSSSQRAARIHPEWQDLTPGSTVRLAPMGWMGLRHGLTLEVEQVVDESTLVLRGTRPGFPWETVWSLHLLPRWQDRCRLLVRTRSRLRHPGEVILVELAGPVIALVTRGLLLGIKHRVTEAAMHEPPPPSG